jgi:hypothetical protein
MAQLRSSGALNVAKKCDGGSRTSADEAGPQSPLQKRRVRSVARLAPLCFAPALMRHRRLPQIVQQALCCSKIGCRETFAESCIDLNKHLSRFVAAVLSQP